MRAQYEELPYPERKPLDETKRILMPMFDGIDRINHICHGGKKDFTKNSRILIAGGGTGDSTIFLAEQMRHSDCEIVYLDMSQASMAVARERADMRGLENITWVHDSILNLPSLGLGPFDHISCSGVLMVLEDPDAGLKALESVLAEDGSMHIMVYAEYGRFAIYMMQNLLRLINHDTADTTQKLHNCRELMNSIHNQHWFHFAKHLYIEQRDIEIYDLFLISQDRAYTVPELYDYIEGAGLEIITLLYENEGLGNLLYEPQAYLQDKAMLESLAKLPLQERQASAELLNGRMGKHSLYAASGSKPQPDSRSLDFIPSLPVTTVNVEAGYQQVRQAVAAPGDFVVITVNVFNTNITVKKTPHVEGFFRHLDGNKTLREIFDRIIAANQGGGLDYDKLSTEFEDLFVAMRKCDYLPMRHKSIPAYRTGEDMVRHRAY